MIYQNDNTLERLRPSDSIGCMRREKTTLCKIWISARYNFENLSAINGQRTSNEYQISWRDNSVEILFPFFYLFIFVNTISIQNSV